ncbi:MAG: FAD-dependent monooxygenase [Humibacter sp.]
MSVQRRALVVGLGIAGMSAAVALRDAGWSVVVVERALQRRGGGYFVGLFPDGKKAAKELAVLQHLHTRNPIEGTDWQINARGKRTASFGFLDQPGEPSAVMRGDIEAALWERMQTGSTVSAGDAQTPVRFATRPISITQEENLVIVSLENVETGEITVEEFDLLVGADGLRSSVRHMVFGEHERFMKSWNAIICAFELERHMDGYHPQDGVTLALPKRAAWVFPFSDRTPTALLTYRTANVDEQFALPAVETLKGVYSDLSHHPIVRHSLENLENAPRYLFDSVHSVHMPTWHNDRVLLLGDSAWCLTLYSGMGSTSALRGAATLGRKLSEHPEDITTALAEWEKEMRPFISMQQKRARIAQHMFVPTGRMSSAIRNAAIAVISRALRGRKNRDRSAAQPA